MQNALTMEDRFVGCLLAGACGDSLGEPVEFSDENEIFDKYGPPGIRDLVTGELSKAIFTDDTQMTLFTAEGLLSTILSLVTSNADLKSFRADDAIPGLHQAYLRWLATQSEESKSPFFKEVVNRGMLAKQAQLYHKRGPGITCLTSLISGTVGSKDNKINDSKGCGGIMRVAPCGMIVHSAFPFLAHNEKAELAFELGCVSAAITHTHSSGWLSSGCQAAIISRILSGDSLESAMDQTIPLLVKEPSHEETLHMMIQAKNLAREFETQFEKTEHGNSAELSKQKTVLRHLQTLGRGFVGEEALGISLYCALITQKDKDVEKALCYAVNHSGDSDSTGAIAGNLVGALYGESAIPAKWTDKIQMRDFIQEVSKDLLNVAVSTDQQALAVKYPPPITFFEGEEYYKNKENLVLPTGTSTGSHW